METQPTCIGFIMDGNRRWAKERDLQTLEGHKAGYETFKNIIERLHERGIKHGVFYAFSTENWKRSEEEVGYLLELLGTGLRELLDREDTEEDTRRVRIRFIGDRTAFSETLQGLMTDIEEKTREYTDTTIWIAVSYGGRSELVEAVKKLDDLGEVTEESLRAELWSGEMPDPDLVIRTGGQQRISNFLLWHVAYSELFFPKQYWPDFTPEDLNGIIAKFSERKRNFGK